MTVMTEQASMGVNCPIFSDEELELAQLFKAYGLDWTPAPGQYVLDQGQLIEAPSPFQDRVYFILELKHFLRRSGTLDALKERMCWLPTFEQSRLLLRRFGLGESQVAERLCRSGAIARGSERLELYRMIEDCLTAGVDESQAYEQS
jgi:hypothetical protein